MKTEGIHSCLGYSSCMLVRNQWHNTLMQLHISPAGQGLYSGWLWGFRHTPWAPSSASSSPLSKMRGGTCEVYALFTEGPLFCCYSSRKGDGRKRGRWDGNRAAVGKGLNTVSSDLWWRFHRGAECVSKPGCVLYTSLSASNAVTSSCWPKPDWTSKYCAYVYVAFCWCKNNIAVMFLI